MKQLKVLHVVRHAKSAWDYDGVADIDSPLKSRGIKNAYEISRRLKLSDLVPQKIISSPADRALHTAVIFARVFDYPMKNWRSAVFCMPPPQKRYLTSSGISVILINQS